MTTPNIFSCVTDESLQDAFICYLVTCATQATGDLQKCGSAFVRTLFRAGASDGAKSIPVVGPDGTRDLHTGQCKVSDVCKPNWQHSFRTPDRKRRRLDVDFQAKVDGKTVTFLIENKTDTEAHSDPLRDGLDFIIKEQKSDLIKPVYFKTGYVFSNERAVVECNKYSVFEAKDMKKFLDGQEATAKNEILRQYAEHLDNLIETRGKEQKKWDLNCDHVQWEFMLKLRETLEDAASEWQCFIPKDFQVSLDRGLNILISGKNNGGSPWTAYGFSKHLYWRIDSGKRLRLMIVLHNAELDYDEVQEEYRSCFKEVLCKERVSGRVGQSRGRKPWQECTAGSIEIPEFQEMTVSDFLERVKRVHIGFLKRMRQSYESTQ